MSNIIQAFLTIAKNPRTKLTQYHDGKNRINNIGKALEVFIQDAFADTLNERDNKTRLSKYQEIYSYQGNQNNPPDLMLKNSDAIEVKKLQSKKSAIALNSSYSKACKECEIWESKEIIYAIGETDNDTLKTLWLVYGDCFCADKETYERIKTTISLGIESIPDVEFTATNKLGKVKKVNPLGITDLRIRGIWHIDNPNKIFNYIYCDKENVDFQLICLMKKAKYDSFHTADIEKEKNNIIIKDVKIKDPNNPINLIDAKILLFKGGSIMNIISLFSGAGGLDLGFEKAGFNTIWANEYDKDIWETYEKNFPHTALDRRSITKIPSIEIPEALGIIGGPPCQSWSEAGKLRGIDDDRGQLFFEFIRLLRDKKPLFFLAENVSGMLASRHSDALENIQILFKESGYKLSFKLLDVHDYKVPQTRKRVFFVGYREDLDIEFKFPKAFENKRYLKDVIWDLKENALHAKEKNHSNGDKCKIANHEYAIGTFSTMYMSRNRVRSWDEPSFTIQAGGRDAPLHPQAPKMEFIEQNKRIFVPTKENLYRRLSVRECARIQTFPDTHKFYYKNVIAGYKMVGNAVPAYMGYYLEKKIMQDLQSLGLTSALKETKQAERIAS
ncbi:MAG TPA: DNA (cytosine-5-)-methyltransferase [Campylobacterales bacterium]|nr:DNA (cytosine-5-)-methyltransferase [Campylobacterales bacterium]